MSTLKNDLYRLIKTNAHAFDFILESSSKALWYCTLGDGENIWTNSEFKLFLGYKSKDILNNWDQFIREEELLMLKKELEAQDILMPPLLLANYKQKNGVLLQAHCNGLIVRDKQDEFGGILFAIDNTINHHTHVQQKYQLLDEKLRISEERFRRAFEHAAIGMAIISASGNWMRVNNSLSKILGYDHDELLRLTFQDITHPDDLDKDLDLLNELETGKRESYQMEKRYFHKNGQLVWVILAVSAIKDGEGRLLHFISQITDISKIKETEQEIKSVLEVTNDQNKRLLNFAHIVSHNLRSHSGNLIMLLNFMETDTDDRSRTELFRMFKGAAANLQETIGHLNEVVAVNTTLQQNLVKVNLHHAIAGAIGNIEALLKAEDVDCVNNITKDVIIYAIPAYLDSILLNFLTNAIKYHSPDRKPTIELFSAVADDWTILSIKDNGIGIDLNANREKLFGMYKTFHTNKDARGIGLFITKNQIEAMGGKVSVESELDKGTTFRIYFKKADNLQ